MRDNMKQNIIELTCPNCGSNSIDTVGNTFVCNHCKTKFLKKENSSNKTINIMEIKNIKNDKDAYLIKNTLSENDFLKKALIYLAKCKNSPQNIFDAEFSKPELVFEYISVINYNCNITYSLSIRMERNVKRKVEESYLDKRSNSYKTHLVDKYVTETYYEPYSGKYGDIVSKSIIQNSKYSNFEEQNILKILETTNKDELVNSKEIFSEPPFNQIKNLPDECIDDLVKKYRDYITIKDYRNLKLHDGTASLENITTYKIPIYKLTFNLGNKTYTLYCVANNCEEMFVENLSDLEKENLISNFKSNKNHFFKPLYYSFVISSIAFLIVTPLLVFKRKITSNTSTIVWFVINVILFIIEEILSAHNKKLFKKIVDDYEKTSYFKKKEKCLSYCEKNNIQKPTESEFNAEFKELDEYEK